MVSVLSASALPHNLDAVQLVQLNEVRAYPVYTVGLHFA